MTHWCSGQYVYSTSKTSRDVGVIQSVNGEYAKVSWDVDKPSFSCATKNLRHLTITVGTCVVRGSYGTAVPFLQSPLTVPMGIVTAVDGEHCNVIWDNSSTELIVADNLRDVAHLPFIYIDTNKTSTREWKILFELAHNVDLSIDNDDHDYVCSRANHYYDEGYEHCIRCRPHNQKRSHSVADQCRCSFRLFFTARNGVAFAGTHTIHVPGNVAMQLYETLRNFTKLYETLRNL
jgi:hypothetical protein